MNETSKKKRKGLRWIILGVIVAVLLAVWILAPMKVRQAPPLHVFDLDPEEVVQIELRSPITGKFLTYTEPEEIEELAELLNGLRFRAWSFTPGFLRMRTGGWDQGLDITTQEGYQWYTFSENRISYSDAQYNLYEFWVTDGLEELMERAK